MLCKPLTKFRVALDEIFADHSDKVEPIVIQKIRQALDDSTESCDEDENHRISDFDLSRLSERIDEALKGVSCVNLTFVPKEDSVGLISKMKIRKDPIEVLNIMHALREGVDKTFKSLIGKDPDFALLLAMTLREKEKEGGDK